AGLDWLCDNRPAASDSPSILHLDFHPVNIVVPRDRSPAVLDWSLVDVGDRHADVASTVILLRTAPVEVTDVWQWLLRPAARRAPTPAPTPDTSASTAPGCATTSPGRRCSGWGSTASGGTPARRSTAASRRRCTT